MTDMVAGADRHAVAPSLYKTSTELSADSIEAHPALPYVFAESTYQVDKHDDGTDASKPSSPSYTRRGRCRLRHTERHEDGNVGKCVRVYTMRRSPSSTVLDMIEGAAILDAKWCLASRMPTDDYAYGLLGLANAMGSVSLFRLESGEADAMASPSTLRLHRWKEWQLNSQSALCLSMDWSDRTAAPHDVLRDARLLVSQSNGTLTTVPSVACDSGTPAGMETWDAHGYEAWIAAWDCWSNGMVAWSGGDDLALKGWDLREPIHDGERQPTFTCQKGFDGGVTAIQSHATRQHYWAVGSYDERVRVFDARQPRRPLSETHVGGGVWRLKWHPTLPSTLLVGCMHDGCKVLQSSALAEPDGVPDTPMDVVCRFDEHKSIAYGCDWERGALLDRDENLVYSCSFYDATLHAWSWR